MIISTVTTQASSNKLLNLFTIKKKKTLNKLGAERNFLNLLKGLYQKPIADIIFNDKGVDEFPLRLRTRQGCSLFNGTRGSSQGNQANKRNKRYPDWKRKVKLSLFTNDTILHMENLNESTKNS